MERIGLKKSSVLATLVVLVICGSILPLIMIPPVTSTTLKTIKIGVISPDSFSTPIIKSLYETVVQPDINAYMAKLPRERFMPNVRFEFQIVDAVESDDAHLSLVKAFHKKGVDIIIGGAWSSQAAASLDYVNEHNILLLSPSSSTPSLSIPGDNLFRLFPDDSSQGKAIAAMLLSKDVTKAIVFCRDDDWGKGVLGVFQTEYGNIGGTIVSTQIYPTSTTDFTSYLALAEAAASGGSDEGILVLSYNEVAELCLKAGSGSYPKLYSHAWFGADGTAWSQPLLDNAPDEAVHLKIYSTTPAPTRSIKFNEMASRFEAAAGFPMDFSGACWIDVAWIAALGVVETQRSIIPNVSAKDVINVLLDDCSRYFGYSGWCKLNDAGDRLSTNYEIVGYGLVGGVPSFNSEGFYDSLTGQVTWIS